MKIIMLSTVNCIACIRMEKAIENKLRELGGGGIVYRKVNVCDLPKYGIDKQLLNMRILPLTFSAKGERITKKSPIEGFPAANFESEFKRIMEG